MDEKNPYAAPSEIDDKGSYPPRSEPLYAMRVVGRVGAGCAIGGSVGGCLIPFALFVICAFVLGDMGGPLFWPFFAIFVGVLGALLGSLTGLVSALWKRTKRAPGEDVEP